MNATEALDRFGGARVARLATIDAAGRPHLVPIVFAMSGMDIVTAVDSKPKRTHALKRLANIAANPAVSVLADEYSDDWTRLWWVRIDGSARILEHGDAAAFLPVLVDKYGQYRSAPPTGPVVLISIDKVVGWSGSG